MNASRIHALTIDVEDYFQVTAFESVVSRDAWETYVCRLPENMDRLLDLLAEHRTRGTFFILGWVAEHYPHVVRRIAQAGHEIGSHSYWHRRVYDLSPDEFRADLVRSRRLLEDIAGCEVTSYRAPTFSVTRRSQWALEILAEEGFRIDSSIFPIRHDRYGIPDAPVTLHEITTPSGSLWEFPPSSVRLAGLRVPVAGGGYFRLMPWWWTEARIRQWERETSAPLMFYLHPWEIDPQQPIIAGASRMSRWRHRVGLATTETKLRKLLSTFGFGAIGDVCPAAQGASDFAEVAA